MHTPRAPQQHHGPVWQHPWPDEADPRRVVTVANRARTLLLSPVSLDTDVGHNAPAEVWR